MRRSNKPLFTLKESMEAIGNNIVFYEQLKACTNVKEWNDTRDSINFEFTGTMNERLAFFGYADGVLHPMIFGKTCEEIPECK